MRPLYGDVLHPSGVVEISWKSSWQTPTVIPFLQAEVRVNGGVIALLIGLGLSFLRSELILWSWKTGELLSVSHYTLHRVHLLLND